MTSLFDIKYRCHCSLKIAIYDDLNTLLNITYYTVISYAIVQNIFPEVQIPTWQAIARGETEGNSVSSRYLHRGKNILHYCLFKLEITVLLPNYI